MFFSHRNLILRISVLMVISCFSFHSINAQILDTTIYVNTEIPARYIYGQDILLRDIRNNIDYNGNPGLITMKGRLKVTYVVEKDGCASQVTTFPPGYANEIKRLFDTFIGWYPAQVDGKQVRSVNVLSLYFNLH